MQRITYLDFVHETLGRTLYSGGLFCLRELLVPDKVVPALAPHIYVLATSRGRPSISSTSSLEAAWVSSPAASPPVVVAGITDPWTRPGDPVAEETPTRGGVGTFSLRRGEGLELSPPSATFLGGGVPIASLTLVRLLAAVLVEAGSSSALSGTAAARSAALRPQRHKQARSPSGRRRGRG